MLRPPMGWYDLFSNFYDRSLEPLYREQRVLAIDALAIDPGDIVLDLPCGTGLSLVGLAARTSAAGRVLGVDLSKGMLARARARVDEAGCGSSVTLLQADVHALDRAALQAAIGSDRVDRLHVFLGLSAFPEWERAFSGLWELLAPGGRCVVVDVHAQRLGFQGRMVNLVAGAEIRRRTWEPLERVAIEFERRPLPTLPQHGGELFLALGRKP